MITASSQAIERLQLFINTTDMDNPVCGKLLSDFKDNRWRLRLGENEQEFTVDFDYLLEANISLIDEGEEELLKSVKWLILLSIVPTEATKGRALTTKATVMKHLAKTLYFIRYMRLQGIKTPKNVTQSMVDGFAKNFIYTSAHNLDYMGRYVDFAQNNDLLKYVYQREQICSKKEDFEFDLTSMLKDIGIEVKGWAEYKELAEVSLSLYQKYETFERSTKAGKNKSSIHAINKAGTVDSQAKSLNRNLKIAKWFPELVPCFPSEIKTITNAQLRHIKKSAKESGKTADVPFSVMKNTIERSIDFVMHYGKQLIEKRDETVALFEELCSSKPDKHRYELAKEHFRKNPIILNGSQHTRTIKITNFERSIFKARDESNQAKRDQAVQMHSSGMTMASVASELGTTKGTVSRWVNDARDPFHADPVNHGFKNVCYHLFVAIEMILCFFTARRSAEIMALRAGCMSKTESGHWIEMYVAKTYRVNDQFTATNLIKICIDILEELSRPAREATGNDNLWQLQQFVGQDKDKYEYRFKDQKNEYLKFIGIEDEFKWEFSEHQFRRFFAGVFVNHFGGSMDALKYHLRHTDVQMTFEYINSIESEKTADAYTRAGMAIALAEQHTLSGGFDTSTDIGKEFDECAKRIKAIPAARAESAYEEVMEDNDIVFVMIESGLCAGNTKRRREQSSCVTGDEMAHTFRACDDLCEGCPNLLRLDNWTFKNIEDQCLLNPEISPIFQAALA
ncbi:hypothetical protein AKJ18_00390 [Vibrio xuii]|nr:hypothetical protein AKJ18_00390 [Vibrio xuii]